MDLNAVSIYQVQSKHSSKPNKLLTLYEPLIANFHNTLKKRIYFIFKFYFLDRELNEEPLCYRHNQRIITLQKYGNVKFLQTIDF